MPRRDSLQIWRPFPHRQVCTSRKNPLRNDSVLYLFVAMAQHDNGVFLPTPKKRMEMKHCLKKTRRCSCFIFRYACQKCMLFHSRCVKHSNIIEIPGPGPQKNPGARAPGSSIGSFRINDSRRRKPGSFCAVPRWTFECGT